MAKELAELKDEAQLQKQKYLRSEIIMLKYFIEVHLFFSVQCLV